MGWSGFGPSFGSQSTSTAATVDSSQKTGTGAQQGQGDNSGGNSDVIATGTSAVSLQNTYTDAGAIAGGVAIVESGLSSVAHLAETAFSSTFDALSSALNLAQQSQTTQAQASADSIAAVAAAQGLGTAAEAKSRAWLPLAIVGGAVVLAALFMFRRKA